MVALGVIEVLQIAPVPLDLLPMISPLFTLLDVPTCNPVNAADAADALIVPVTASALPLNVKLAES